MFPLMILKIGHLEVDVADERPFITSTVEFVGNIDDISVILKKKIHLGSG